MKNKNNYIEKPLVKSIYPNQILINNYISIITELSSLFKKFYESSSKYIFTMKNIIKEINTNIIKINSIKLDESSKKCLSSLNIVFNYIDTSFTQFYSSAQKSFDKINSNRNGKMSLSNKKPNLSKKLISYDLSFDNDLYNNKNIIFTNYQKHKIENRNRVINKKDKFNKYFSLEEKLGNNRIDSSQELNNNNNYTNDSNISGVSFIKNVQNLLNILKYENINFKNNKNIDQKKLDKIKEKLIYQLSNSLNNGNEQLFFHRRIRSVNTSIYSYNSFINDENKINNKQSDNQIIKSNEKNNNTRNLGAFFYNKNKGLNKTVENIDKYSSFENLKISNHHSYSNLNTINKARSMMNQNNYKSEKLQEKIDILVKNKKDLLIQIAELITKNNSLLEEVSNLKSLKLNMNKIEIEKNRLNKIIDELNEKLTSAIDSKKEIEKMNLSLRESIDKYESEKLVQKKEYKKIKDYLEQIKKENIILNKYKNDLENENKLNKKKVNELNIQITQIEKENEIINNIINDTNNKKEEYKEKIKKLTKELDEEKGMNIFLEQKIKKLEKKLEEYNINVFDDTKTKTYKINYMNKVNEIEVEKLPKKYTSPYNYRKNISGLSTNINSNKVYDQNLDDNDVTPENYTIVKYCKLGNKLKWYLLKKIKKQNNEYIVTDPTPSPSQYNYKQSYRRYKILRTSTNYKLSNERKDDSYSDYIWKPNKNERDFINFNFNNIENIENDKNECSISKERKKKINELELCIKDLEEKLEKKENDCNRINLNYAKLFKRTKIPDEIYDKLLENNEKLKNENKLLKKKVDNFKSTQDFIRMSFIADDLEGSRFIDDKCFEEILDGLVEKKNRHEIKKVNENKKDENYEINMMKYFKSNGDDNNKDINNEINNNNNNNIEENKDDNKENVKDDNNDDKEKKEIKKLEYKRHFHYKIEETYQSNKEPNKNKEKEEEKEKEKENENEKNVNGPEKEEKAKNEQPNKIERRFESKRFYNKKTENKKYIFHRYNNKKNINHSKNDEVNTSEKHNENLYENGNDNKEKEKENENEIKTIVRNKNYYQNKYKRKIESKEKNDEIKDNISNKEKEMNRKLYYINTDNNLEQNHREENRYLIVKTENDEKENSGKNLFTRTRHLKSPFKKNYASNNDTNDENVINNYRYKKNDKFINSEKNEKEYGGDNRHYKSLKTMKMKIENKNNRKFGLQESSSHSNRVCRGRRFYKKKQEDLKLETNVSRK